MGPQINGGNTTNKEFVVRLLSVILALVMFMLPIIYYTGRIVARLDQLGDDVRELKISMESMKKTDAILSTNQAAVAENQRLMIEFLGREARNGRQQSDAPK